MIKPNLGRPRDGKPRVPEEDSRVAISVDPAFIWGTLLTEQGIRKP